MEILFSVILAIFSICITWWITHCYYRKSMSDQAAQWGKIESQLLDKLDDNASTDKLVLYEQRINSAIQDYKRKGTPKYIIDTLNDLSLVEKEKMYDDVLLRIKGRKGKGNPYKQSE